MKTFVAVCLLACAAAFPQTVDVLEGSGEPPVEITARSGLDSVDTADILRSEFEMDDNGQFQYGFETSDGTAVDAAGENRQIGDAAGIVMRGSYSYKSPEGVDVTIDWEADENGFRAFGDQVPKAPEYVTALLKSLPTGEVSIAPVEEAAPVPAVVEAAPEAVADEAVPAIAAEAEVVSLVAYTEVAEEVEKEELLR